jgi:peptidoglycan/LPS O-acetylase OafA/YrhL
MSDLQSPNASGYMPQLDGLRAIAIAPVLIQHWGGNELSLRTIPIGGFGVGLFFALSGFLITSILLRIRTDSAQQNISSLWYFWIRRILRLLPSYYFTLSLGYLFQIDGIQQYLLWHSVYLTNFLTFQGVELGYATHFWTLAIEEQFYLIWPIIILFTPQKWLACTMVAFAVSTPIARIYFSQSEGWLNYSFWALPICQLDYLCLGAFTAYLNQLPAANTTRIAKLYFAIGTLGFAILAVAPTFLGWLNHSCYALICCGVVILTANGLGGIAGSFLKSSPVTAIGKISYEIYLLHMLAPFFAIWLYYSAPIPGYRLLPRLGISDYIINSSFFQILSFLTITILLSSFSWFAIERPCRRLKNFFRYKAKPSLSKHAAS